MSINFLPTNLKEAKQKGWNQLDIILVTGDAYVDHPSFGAALICRYLESHGYKVGIIPQPNWHNTTDFKALGKPRLFFGVTAGNLDSMVANYTSEKRKRKIDMYSEDGKPNLRPDRATIVYTNCIKQCYPDTTIILGGLEASLRRLAHYDYWSNKFRRSLLFDSRANLIVYGMGEKTLVNIARKIDANKPLTNIPNTAYISREIPEKPHIELPSYEELKEDKKLYAQTSLKHAQEIAKKEPLPIVQKHQNRYLVIEPPKLVDQKTFDSIFHLPFQRQAHSQYKKPIPAFTFVRHSVLAHRGCYGGCSFCSLGAHQGKYIVSRSEQSIIKEVTDIIAKDPTFTGTILDVGGPSANMYASTCKSKNGCERTSCLYPSICKNLDHSQKHHLKLLSKLTKLKSVKNVFINSGIRFDLALKDATYINTLCKSHTCGQLSIAPEHTSDTVLKIMQKPEFETYKTFVDLFNKANKKYNKKQYIIPYFIAAHPGCTLEDMYKLSLYLKENHLQLKQVQSYIPLPLTLSEAMYYSGYNVFNLKKLHIPNQEERAMQRALLQPHLKTNHRLLQKALKKLGKEKMFYKLTKY
jgi:uncharacterized radical SAM protein YgiQ